MDWRETKLIADSNVACQNKSIAIRNIACQKKIEILVPTDSHRLLLPWACFLVFYLGICSLLSVVVDFRFVFLFVPRFSTVFRLPSSGHCSVHWRATKFIAAILHVKTYSWCRLRTTDYFHCYLALQSGICYFSSVVVGFRIGCFTCPAFFFSHFFQLPSSG